MTIKEMYSIYLEKRKGQKISYSRFSIKIKQLDFDEVLQFEPQPQNIFNKELFEINEKRKLKWLPELTYSQYYKWREKQKDFLLNNTPKHWWSRKK